LHTVRRDEGRHQAGIAESNSDFARPVGAGVGVFATHEGDFVFGRGTGLNRGAFHLLVTFRRKNGIVATYYFVPVHPVRQQPLIIRDFIPNRDWKERYRKPGTDFRAGK
jgi:hypothetical protein